MLGELTKKNMTLLFHVVDFDKDGVLSKADYEGIVERFSQELNLPPESESYKELSSLFMAEWKELEENMDTNKDGVVDLEELLDFHSKMFETEEGYELVVKSYADSLSLLLDRDKDGRISIEDYKIFLKGYGCDVSNVQTCFAKLDLNSDGFIDSEEFKILIEQWTKSENPDDPGHWLFGQPAWV